MRQANVASDDITSLKKTHFKFHFVVENRNGKPYTLCIEVHKFSRGLSTRPAQAFALCDTNLNRKRNCRVGA